MKTKFLYICVIFIASFCLLSAGCTDSDGEQTDSPANDDMTQKQSSDSTFTATQTYTPSPTKTITPVPTPTERTGPPVYISSLSLGGEYVTITNSGSSSATLTGWKLTDETDKTYTFPSFTLGSGKSVTVYSGPDAKGGVDSATKLYWTAKYIWNNDGDTAKLYNSAGKLIDTHY